MISRSVLVTHSTMDYIPGMEIEASAQVERTHWNWGLIIALLFCAASWALMGLGIAAAV